MSYFSQTSWFGGALPNNTQIADPSQDLFTTQDLLASQSQYITSQNDSPDFSQFCTSQNIPSQSQNVEDDRPLSQFLTPQSKNDLQPSQFLTPQSKNDLQSSQFLTPQSNNGLQSSQFFNTQHSNVQLIGQNTYHSATFQSQIQEELNFLEKNSQFIFDSQSQEVNQVDESEKMDLDDEIFEEPESQPASSFVTRNSEISFDTDDDLHVPQSILHLYTTLRESHSDWTFLSILAGQIGVESFPMGAYKNLKLSLLLSLASIKNGSMPIPIVAIGAETSHANIIMNTIGQFADKFLTSLMNFEGSTVDNNSGTIEAGPLLLAKGGVLYIGDWSRLPPKKVMKLLREIENGQVMTEKVQQSAPLECALWTFWSCSTNMKKDVASINQFMNVFGVPVMIDDAAYDLDIINNLLEPTNPDDSFQIPEGDMITYLSFVSKQKTEMEPDAVEMLKNYFAATRTIRENSLTPKAYAMLQQMAESHAKLCFRQKVTRQDVLGVISISEKFIRALFDKDSFSSPPEPKFTAIGEIDEYHDLLYKWLLNFTKNILQRQI